MASDVDLGPQLESYVASLVEKGRYNSKSEVLREGIRLVQEREERLAALDAGIARGLADSAAGRVKPASEVFDRLEARYKTWQKRPRPDEGLHHGRREADLEHIGDWIGESNPLRAVTFVQELAKLLRRSRRHASSVSDRART